MCTSIGDIFNSVNKCENGAPYKRASVCSTSNYRPIALASIMSKLLEKIILNRISDNLVTNPISLVSSLNIILKCVYLRLKKLS